MSIPIKSERDHPHLRRYYPAMALFTVLFAVASGCSLRSPSERPVRIAFTSDRGGNFEIYLMDRNGSGITNLTQHPAEDRRPIFSSVKNSISFVSNRGPGEIIPGSKKYIYRMDEHGDMLSILNARLPATTDHHSWAPDGEWVAFEGGRDDRLDVFLLNASRGTVRNLTGSPAKDRLAGWSPGGEELLFTSNRDGRTAIYRADRSSGEIFQLTDPSFTSAFPNWSPDGEMIAFTSNRDGDVEVYVMDRDGQNLLRVTDSPGFDGFPKWSPRGNGIAFISTRDGSADIYVIRPDGSSPKNLTQTPSSHESIQGDFSWAPDGSQILFHANREGNPDVFVMNADGTQQVNLTSHPADDLQAIWIP